MKKALDLKMYFRICAISPTLMLCFFYFFAEGNNIARAAQNGKPTAVANQVITTDHGFQMWPGICTNGPNGLKVRLHLWGTNTPDPMMSVAVGSLLANSGTTYRRHPKGCIFKIELHDSTGGVVPPTKYLPKEAEFESRLPMKAFLRHGKAEPNSIIGFLTNSPPAVISTIKLKSLYRIEKEGDYTVTVCPIVYKVETNGEYLDRIVLPCISGKLHILPDDIFTNTE